MSRVTGSMKENVCQDSLSPTCCPSGLLIIVLKWKEWIPDWISFQIPRSSCPSGQLREVSAGARRASLGKAEYACSRCLDISTHSLTQNWGASLGSFLRKFRGVSHNLRIRHSYLDQAMETLGMKVGRACPQLAAAICRRSEACCHILAAHSALGPLGWLFYSPWQPEALGFGREQISAKTSTYKIQRHVLDG